MLKNRNDLYRLAKDYYIRLMERTARRYEMNEIYLTVDHLGYECTRIEELFRPLWGIAPFLQDEEFRITVGGQKRRVSDFITKVMIGGTDKTSDRRLDKNVTADNAVKFANQCITEIAAYLVAVYFAKDVLWTPLSVEQKEQIAQWILHYAMIALKDSWPNNHYWYPVFCIEILKQLGYYDPDSDVYMEKAYGELEGMYVSNGWYCDGKQFGRFDFYEAWAHHAYTLLWTLIADKNTEDYQEKSAKYKARTAEFIKLFSHYFDADGGMCAYGRSLSYRFAAVSVFGLAAVADCKMDLGLAKSILLRNIGYFFEQSLPSPDGVFGCGYLYESARFAENYASDGASTCYTEGFMCLLANENHPLWQAEAAPLLIERGDYLVDCPVENLDFLVQGEKEYGGVTLFNNSIHYFQDKNSAFNDMASYYGKFCYNSRAGFAISTRDKPSFDNMISLATEDLSMTSLRTKIIPLYADKTQLVSCHLPFANDPQTAIVSYTVPLSKGYHVRIHQVRLSQPYIIREGGFCIGTTDDERTFAAGCLTIRNTVSKIEVVSNTETAYRLERIHPGMHNLRPLAYYPSWTTGIPVPAGEYLFVTTVLFTDHKIPQEKPLIQINGNIVLITFGGERHTVDLQKSPRTQKLKEGK
ncbi:MAG: DUF2264 domain-containing protein [Clostridia bacterium]|nr:DUF2264 domain-containing protein [Clostridia bacterium]